MKDLLSWAFHSLGESLLLGRFCLVVGAGASCDLGLPQWNELIARARSSISPPPSEAVRPEPALGPLDLQYQIWNLAGEVDEQLPRLLYRPLILPCCGSWQEWESRPEADKWHLWDGWHHRAIEERSAVYFLSILAILTALVSPSRPFHLITFNADCLLEEMISRLGHRAVAVVGQQRISWEPRRGVEPLVTASNHADQRRVIEVRVFHPHGLALPPGTGGRRGLAADVENLVFGNSDYNQLFNSGGDPRNLCLLAALSCFQCLFYGLSFTDSNVNRLLDWQSQITLAAGPDREDGALSSSNHCALIRGYSDREESIRHQLLLARAGVYRLGHYDFDQHRSFVAELLEKLHQRDPELSWPDAG